MPLQTRSLSCLRTRLINLVHVSVSIYSCVCFCMNAGPSIDFRDPRPKEKDETQKQIRSLQHPYSYLLDCKYLCAHALEQWFLTLVRSYPRNSVTQFPGSGSKCWLCSLNTVILCVNNAWHSLCNSTVYSYT